MKEMSNLAKFVYKRTYARQLPDSVNTENWEDTVKRVIEGNVAKYRNTPLLEDNEEERLAYYMLNRKAMPAGRMLWLSGTDTQRILGGAGLNNCFYFSCNDYHNFVIAQDLLMLGGGIGMSVEHEFVSKLPKVKKDVRIFHKATNDADFIVPDSREGWGELTRKVLKAFFETGKGFSYSTVCVRGAGEPIKAFGGKASGPIPLIDFVTKICAIFKAREGKSIRPIDASDIICSIGEMVVAGNVRRSAIIVLGDCWDKTYLKAKRFDLQDKGLIDPIPNQRAMANFSVVCDDIEDVHNLFWDTYKNGEPFGIVNRTNMKKFARMGEKKVDTAVGVNPCQPENAILLTKSGLTELKNVSIGDEVWSEEGWTKVINKWSNGIKDVWKFKTTAGHFLGTGNHKVLQDGVKVEVINAENIDTLQGDINNNLPINPSDIVDGLVFGDGSVHKASNNKIFLYIGEKDKDYFTSEIRDFILESNKIKSPYSYDVVTTLNVEDLVKTFNRVIPSTVFNDISKYRGFLKGLYSANGSICGNRITLKSSSFTVVEQVQLMLSALGIKSYFTTNKANNVKFSNGEYPCKESYDLNITTDRNKFYNIIGFLQGYKTEKLEEIIKIEGKSKKSYEVYEVEFIKTEEVFDITVDNNSHTYWTGGLNVSNCGEISLESGEACCLSDIFMPNLANEEEFKEAARLMFRFNKRVTCENYHQPVTDEVVKRNRRTGVGITGCLQSELFVPVVLDSVYQVIQKENVEYSKLLGVPESIRTTTVKPSGTVSLIADTTAGIHPAYSKYYIRRVRISSTDDLVPLLREAGHNIKPVIKFDNTLDHDTLVVDFPCKAPEGTPVADEDWDTFKQLEALKTTQKYWSDNSVSVTVYYKKEDLSSIKEWLKDNLSELKTISFLCHSEHGFIQAPYEAITEEEYEKAIKNIKPLDLSALIKSADVELDDCNSGACPIK